MRRSDHIESAAQPNVGAATMLGYATLPSYPDPHKIILRSIAKRYERKRLTAARAGLRAGGVRAIAEARTTSSTGMTMCSAVAPASH